MSKRVLLVDDNSSVRSLLKSYMSSSGYKIVEACDGLDGLTKAKNDLFDIFVIDYKMPVMDGITLIKGLKDLPQYADHPMILLTTDNGAAFEYKVSAIDNIDNIDILCKPIDSDQLLGLMAQHSGLETALIA
jgi:two-component system chemotaxis response regulator CheY